ncbi:rhodanese-related sulfurtransferase [Lishizhenia sp.]|uniref:oxygen-dependent tRNA uridine(34) hydroxylase TrhO n=1 Tax=Lishizhenia sp. TaxID=2497594 RepID=UPI00299DC47F|nr:rhodanese-related sulfurtransferase [Lishizhenia sp.]MDX1446157.1 rhodanese-related sulfurtransferase [Lishizhenia sp.]
MQLWNKLSREELVEKLNESGFKFVTVSFYKYAPIENVQVFRDHLFQMWSELDVVGRTYVAHEGINAQISIPIPNFERFRNELYAISFLDGVRLNIAVDESATEHPFLKLKIKVRPKILADGLNDETFNPSDTGKHLKVEEFNALTDDPETILIDMRNHYETEVGHFKGAITPDVDTFRDSLPVIEEEILRGNEDKNIVMYCTGGIRCEKASAWFKHQGYKNVHQLEGGIIKYANDAKDQGLENKFIGKNFVFDERRGERISDDVIAVCHQCGEACDTHTNCVNDACHLLFIQCDSCKEKYENCCSEDCQDVIHLPEEEQKALRKGKENSNKIFKKGRSEKLKFKGSACMDA